MVLDQSPGRTGGLALGFSVEHPIDSPRRFRPVAVEWIKVAGSLEFGIVLSLSLPVARLPSRETIVSTMLISMFPALSLAA